jgi:DNA polymerase I-like protein with 3'-5' exonuclease and polymerase domains
VNCLFLGTPEDKEYLPAIKPFFGGTQCYVLLIELQTLTQLEMYCAKNSINRVVSTSTALLSKLLRIQGKEDNNPSLSNYAGSLFSYKNLEVVFIDPLSFLYSIPHQKFITERFISKVCAPHKWRESTPFSWTLLTPANHAKYYTQFQDALAIAVDIETFRHNLAIRCISYTAIHVAAFTGKISTATVVLPIIDSFAVTCMRKFNELQVPKIFQNGKYDNAYLLRYNSPCKQWYFDTAHFFHAWYSELPKDLAFLNAFFLRKVVYWKDLAETNDLFEYYKYNGMDGWATANVFITWLLQSPEWAKRNYALEFPLVYPCLLSEMTGLQRDEEMLQTARRKINTEKDVLQSSLNKILGVPFNVNSAPQVSNLRKTLGSPDIKEGDEKALKRLALRHPLNSIIVSKILKIRELRKEKSTYLRTDEDIKRNKDGSPAANANGSKDYRGFILYSLNPHHTDTGRLASGESPFWCGANIQNIPVGGNVKSTIVPPAGFRIAESDLEKAESWDTAYIVGSKSYIAAVSSYKDFHSTNASAFFGIAYDVIYDDSIRKTKDKSLRDLAKRVNHGANYNMGAGVLVDTMGEDKIWEAKGLLGLPKLWGTKAVAEHLLQQFHKTYPEVQGNYYPSVMREVITTRKLTSRAYHHDCHPVSWGSCEDWIAKGDWTRYCFSDPDPKKNKRALNAYVAHCPQSLNARTLNEGVMKVFYEIALPEAENFRLNAQVHDSILFCFKEGRIDLAHKVKQLMEIPVTVRGIDGVYRTFTVPAGLKAGKDGNGANRWSETE